MTETFDPNTFVQPNEGVPGQATTTAAPGSNAGVLAQHAADRGIEGKVRAEAIARGLDPDKVWAAWQTKGGNALGDVAAQVRKLGVKAKLQDSALISYFADKGVDRQLAVNAVKGAMDAGGIANFQPTPQLIGQVLTSYAAKASTDDAKKITTYLTGDQAKSVGVTAPQPAANGVQNGGGAGFTPSSSVTTGGVDDAFLASLRAQAKNFLTKDQITYLGSTGSPDAFLNAIGGPGGSDQAALAMNTLARTTGGTSGLPAEGDLTASQTQVELSAPDTSDNPDALVPAGSRVPKSRWIDPSEPLHGGKTVSEAIKLLRDLPQDQLINLQRKLVNAGYIARVASGSTTEPDAWGDPTDPSTNAAWRALLTDSIAQGTDVQTLLANGAASFAPKLAELQATKARTDQANALHDALMNQVQVDSMDSLRSAVGKLTANGQMLGHDLSPDEVTNLGQWIQGLQSSQQLAEKHGSSWVPQVDPAASLQQKIMADHPAEFLGQQEAVAAETWARLLKTPGAV